MAVNPEIPVNLSIVNLFKDVFGYTPQYSSGQGVEKIGERTPQNSFGTPYYTTDEFGREVFLPIELVYIDPETQKEGTIKLNHAVLSGSLPVSTVKTKLTERSGTFKEIVSPDDVTISIVGFLISKDQRNMPEDKMRELIKVRKISNVKLKNAISDLYLFDSGLTTDMVIDDLEFPEVYGKQGVKPFRMRLTSDSIYNLTKVD